MIDDPVMKGEWLAVAGSDEVPVDRPLARQLLGEDLVLWRSAEGVLAWRDLCVHRGTRLSMGNVDVENETLTCPYHGWRYDATGACVHMPAHPAQRPPSRAVAATYRAQEKYGLIWVCLGEPTQHVPVFVEWDDSSYRKVRCGPYSAEAAGTRLVENFLDVAHFPFVHTGLLGDQSHAEIEDYEARISPGGVLAEDIRVWQPDPDGTGVGKWVSYTYEVLRPFTARFTKVAGEGRFAIYLTVTPMAPTRSLAWMWIAMNYGADLKDEEVRGFQDNIVAQDIPVVESQRPELLPLDLQAELHLKSDRTAIAYRKWIRSLGMTFGTS